MLLHLTFPLNILHLPCFYICICNSLLCVSTRYLHKLVPELVYSPNARGLTNPLNPGRCRVTSNCTSLPPTLGTDVRSTGAGTKCLYCKAIVSSHTTGLSLKPWSLLSDVKLYFFASYTDVRSTGAGTKCPYCRGILSSYTRRLSLKPWSLLSDGKLYFLVSCTRHWCPVDWCRN